MSGTVQDQIQWLVRKNSPHVKEAGNGRAPSGVTVLGPFLTDQVRAMIDQGMLEVDDELCPENSYWFGLHEVIEVKRFLGIDNMVLPRSAADEETTQPDLEHSGRDQAADPGLVIDSEDKTPPGIQQSDLESQQNSNPDATGIITIKRPAPRSAPSAAPVAKKVDKPAVKVPAPPRPATAQELANKFKRVAQSPMAYRNPASDSAPQRSTLGMEKSQFWGLLIIAGLILAVLGVVWVIRSFRV